MMPIFGHFSKFLLLLQSSQSKNIVVHTEPIDEYFYSICLVLLLQEQEIRSQKYCWDKSQKIGFFIHLKQIVAQLAD